MNRLIDPSAESLRGALQVIRFDDAGFARIDTSDAGFARSWAALLLSLPFLALSAFAIAHVSAADPKIPDFPAGLAFFATILAWLAGAGGLAVVALATGKREKTRALIATSNWVNLWFMLFEAPVNLLLALDMLTGLAGLLNAALGVFALVVGVRVLMTVLKLPLVVVMGLLVVILLMQIFAAALLRGV
jgi:hypothetical protein